jgi:hypothetical protein
MTIELRNELLRRDTILRRAAGLDGELKPWRIFVAETI